ncbi:MAG: hypothetical protein AB1758_18530 [Candidatus Eremiobacterota bacterium]
MLRGNVLILWILGLLLTGCGARWTEYRSGPGGYSVDLPGKVEESQSQVPTPIGTIPFHMAMAESGWWGYAAAYADYPAWAVEKADPKELLNGARRGALSNVGGKLVKERAIEIEGHPGLEIDFNIPDKKIKARARIYLVKNRLYQVLAGNLESRYDEKHMNRFLDSFRLRPRLD